MFCPSVQFIWLGSGSFREFHVVESKIAQAPGNVQSASREVGKVRRRRGG